MYLALDKMNPKYGPPKDKDIEIEISNKNYDKLLNACLKLFEDLKMLIFQNRNYLKNYLDICANH